MERRAKSHFQLAKIQKMNITKYIRNKPRTLLVLISNEIWICFERTLRELKSYENKFGGYAHSNLCLTCFNFHAIRCWKRTSLPRHFTTMKKSIYFHGYMWRILCRNINRHNRRKSPIFLRPALYLRSSLSRNFTRSNRRNSCRGAQLPAKLCWILARNTTLANSENSCILARNSPCLCWKCARNLARYSRWYSNICSRPTACLYRLLPRIMTHSKRTTLCTISTYCLSAVKKFTKLYSRQKMKIIYWQSKYKTSLLNMVTKSDSCQLQISCIGPRTTANLW